MQTFPLTSDAAATTAFTQRRQSGLYARLDTTATGIVLYESQEEWDMAYPAPPPPPPPRWCSSADFVRRFPEPVWLSINQRIAGNGDPADPVLAMLKDKLMTGDPANPGHVNLDSSELSDGLDYLVSSGLITGEEKTALLV